MLHKSHPDKQGGNLLLNTCRFMCGFGYKAAGRDCEAQ